ncbi:hypothetical protein J2Y45_006866 [Dyadobacter sp. BE34]|uniref:Uncharacterized protein n=1 Tax=Dyadobacter fermentans TaxID=94254 RepID=A0ABU1R8K8_9BACT|nr:MULTISPECIES: hypothetical protein [Dyadobacter]MDR6809753.1 hypothetical protein [Dyadobacter fermentans]MDR7047532.1 hypothetical protein [Dyadobacter sp. BE242]MDR7201702.1 hypothetical protein [Dyadobacter sp. BE34]MDR7219572.1 hypothetical protein [Dyadobacter sp. BE31]MDR7267305.1 hypothetical protein [Dyadobacter sp. BE32]
MVAAYNPFEILNLPMIRRITQHGNHFIVLQRFKWPGIKEGFGFMATPYKDEKSGKAHAAQLSGNEGKLLNLSSDIEKITSLINDPRYSLFLCTFREESWNKKMIKLYQRNMISYIKAHMPVTSNDAIVIQMDLKYGRLKATVTANGPEHEFDLYEMIR